MEVSMKESWFNKPASEWLSSDTAANVRDTLDDLRNQFKRNVDMRMKRGDVRAAVLRLLLESPMHGYQIIHEIETRSGGVWKPSAGSVYPALQLLADEGLVEAKETKGRRTYSLTATGREVAEAEAEATAPWETGSDRTGGFNIPSGPRSSLAMAGIKLARAAAEVARLGTNEKITEATKVIDDATAELLAMLPHN
jgi:DNA-binding PadR family transcriptional regulator